MMFEIKNLKNSDFSLMSADIDKSILGGVKVTFTNSTKIKKEKKLFDIITVIN
jgi:hypothetical protein